MNVLRGVLEKLSELGFIGDKMIIDSVSIREEIVINTVKLGVEDTSAGLIGGFVSWKLNAKTE